MNELPKQNPAQLGEFGAAAIGPGGYVSAASLGAVLGLVLPGVGFVIGAIVGGIVDVALGAYNKKKERRRLKKAFYAQLLKRYNTQIFISVLERMGPAKVYLQELGLKPGSDAFDEALKKKLYSEVGYKGNCSVDIFGPAAPGQPRPPVASIDKAGKIQAFNPNIDMALGPKWAEACKEFHKAALQAWAEEQADNILYFRDIEKEKEDEKRKRITRIMINGGIWLVLIGYTIRQKKKLKFLRQYKSQQRQQKQQAKKPKVEVKVQKR